MSREECAALLRNLQLGLDGLQKEVDDLLAKLPGVKTADLGRALAAQKERLQSFCSEQAEEWDRLLGEAGLQVRRGRGSCPSSVSIPGGETPTDAAPAAASRPLVTPLQGAAPGR